ncbi:F-box/WD repeat-containing protein 8 [Megalops cyprinoides]|uniref:F-box/WD repeat-containing protein 8 n=1 Tax=Megalops cyprinoides TaxID=118141 RepID=UPI001864B05D|nr:F-box/WD repeat-containing protein 8 [Megalops cyprinoides]
MMDFKTDMEKDELHAFRERWKKELEAKTGINHSAPKNIASVFDSKTKNEETKNRYFDNRSEPIPVGKHDSYEAEYQETGSFQDERSRRETGWNTLGGRRLGKPASERNEKDQTNYISIAEGLLDGRTSPLRERIQVERTRRKRQFDAETHSCHGSSTQQPQCKVTRDDTLVEQLIHDLNEINEIPFFDMELPYELALKIFQYLSRTELGRCAQVSKSWKALAEDELLWYRLCLKEGYHREASICDSPCWKGTLRDCRRIEGTLRYNWKNRIGAISHLQYELGKVLCDVSSCEGLVIAGYTSGDVRLWDTLNWDSGASYLRPSHVTMGVTPRPHISQVKVNESVAAAAYEDGIVDVWSTETGQEPIHHYQHQQRVYALALGSDGAAVATASGTEVRVDCPVDKGYWRTLCQSQLQKPVEYLLLAPEKQGVPLVVASAGESVYLLRPEQDPDVLHSVYGHPVTCLDVSPSHAALGVKSCGWAMHDGGNKIQVYSLETGQSEVSVGNSAGDFTCINLRDGPAHLLVCGNKDRRVRVFDLRTGSSVASLYAHHLGVTAVQADDWKIVSGGGEGLVCVWELRMKAKLWEMHNRHPVRHMRFRTSTLVTANIPDEKSPRGACITDDDLTAHRRHRGVISLFDFSVDMSSADHVLPICRSSYEESTGYNYNIGLAMPYDTIAASPAGL